MIIYDILEKSKKLFIPALIILTGTFIYGLVLLIHIEKTKEPVTLEYPEYTATSSVSIPVNSNTNSNSATAKTPVLNSPIPSPTQVKQQTGMYVASRGGIVYYLPSCSGAKRISEKNKIWFNSKAEAERFGYKPASNCKGLK